MIASKTQGLGILLIALLGLLPVQAQVQPAIVSGFITDAATGQALELVNLVLRNADGSMIGAVSNGDGLYLITRIPPGEWELTVSFIGYTTVTDTLDLGPDEVRTINLALEVDEAAMDELLVQAEREDGAARVTAGQQTVRPADIERLPAPDVSGDLATFLTAQPGVVSTGDQGGQLFIRGGEPSQNLVRLDGITLFQPFHLLGFYSAFPSEIISRADIYAGGFGSVFGERISSVVDVWTRIGNKRSFEGSASVSPFVSTALIEGPLLRDRLSALISARVSTVEQTMEPLIDRDLPFSFGDFFVKLHADVNRNGRLSVTGLSTYDRGSIRQGFGERTPDRMRWRNQGLGIRYLFLPSVLPVATDFRITYSRLTSELGPVDAPTRVSSVQNIDLSVEATNYTSRIASRVGMEIRLLRIDNALDGLFQNILDEDAAIGPVALFAEPEFDLDWLRVRPGLRMQLHHSTTAPLFEPRLRLLADLGVHHLSAALGRYTQEVIGISDRRDAASVFTAWTSVPRFSPELNDIRVGRLLKSLHAIAGYRVEPIRAVEFSLEGYYKDLTNLLIAEWTPYPRFTTNLQPASGRSYGFDARLEVRHRRFYGYVNYGYSSTLYDAEQEALRLWFGTSAYEFRPAHDRRHQVNVVASTSVQGFELNVRWAFGSGLPFTQAVAFDGFAPVSEITKMTDVPGSRRVLYGAPFGAELPTYHRLDVSVERTFPLRWADLTVQGTLINAYDRANIFYLDVFTYERVDQLPLLPSLGIKIEV